MRSCWRMLSASSLSNNNTACSREKAIDWNRLVRQIASNQERSAACQHPGEAGPGQFY